MEQLSMLSSAKSTHLLVPMLMPGHSRTKALCINLCGQAVAHELHVCDHRYLPLSILQTAKQAFSMRTATRALGASSIHTVCQSAAAV